jgi:hypothetical protein
MSNTVVDNTAVVGTAGGPDILYPVGTRVLTRDGGPGTIVAVQATALVWEECEPGEPGILKLEGSDVVFPRPMKVVEATDECIGVMSVPVEPHYRVRYDRPGDDGRVVEVWLSRRMLTSPAIGDAVRGGEA